MSRPLPHTLTEQTATPAAPHIPTEQTAAPHTPTEQTAAPHTPTEQTAAPASPHTRSARSDWYTDTLRVIVSRALDADKPDIKGALAALQLLAETQDAAASQESDIAHILRDARRRVLDGRQN